VLDDAGLNTRGQGFQVNGGDDNEPPAHYDQLRVLTPDDYTPFRIDGRALPRFDHESLHRTRNPAIFKGPLLICPEGSFLNTTGRYSSTVSRADILYTESFYGVSFAEHELDAALVLSAILSSSLTTFQLAYGGGAWGLERTKVKPNDLLALRIPDLTAAEPSLLQAVLDAERRLAGAPVRSMTCTTWSAMKPCWPVTAWYVHACCFLKVTQSVWRLLEGRLLTR